MIIYGLTMQGKSEEVPQEVATWVLTREMLYPNINFIIDCQEPHRFQVEQFAFMAKKYARFFWKSRPEGGTEVVIFSYVRESWQIRIVGGLDQDENIADLSKEKNIRPLPRDLRNKIAGLPLDTVRVNEKEEGVLREKNDIPLERPLEMVPLLPEGRYTSEVSMSGEELGELLSDPIIGKAAERAIWDKDWETLKRLKEQGS